MSIGIEQHGVYHCQAALIEAQSLLHVMLGMGVNSVRALHFIQLVAGVWESLFSVFSVFSVYSVYWGKSV